MWKVVLILATIASVSAVVVDDRYYFSGTVIPVPANLTNSTNPCDDPCTSTEQCQAEYQMDICVENCCTLKPLFEPFNQNDGIALAVLLVCGLISGGVGIGGGGLYVPVLIFVGYKPDNAIPLSQALIFGAFVSQFALNVRRRDASGLRLIDYEIGLLLLPAAIMGALGGVILNIILPEWMELVAFMITLLGVTVTICYRAWQKWRVARHLSDSVTSSLKSWHQLQMQDSAPTETVVDWVTVVALVVCCLVALVVILVKGGAAVPESMHVRACSEGYWALLITGMATLLAISVVHGVVLARKTSQGVIDASAIKWAPGRVSVYTAYSALCGLVAACVGLGGEVMLSPLMLRLNLPPTVAAATASFSMMFASLAAILNYWSIGRTAAIGACWYTGIGVVSALVGHLVIHRIVTRYNKMTWLLFLLAGVGLIASVLMGVIGIPKIQLEFTHGRTRIRSLCEMVNG
eukprot:TRINITY_DN9075_c0_g1_i1.p1 TRINITY_DN9075_c0_g1~~TRINITY_DN9075_c0_g1_i1.p1  ORF type:complete len:463 (-),score=82.79 TRINITY_DN9075_c0_g1_i1:24-1412(-)